MFTGKLRYLYIRYFLFLLILFLLLNLIIYKTMIQHLRSELFFVNAMVYVSNITCHPLEWHTPQLLYSRVTLTKILMLKIKPFLSPKTNDTLTISNKLKYGIIIFQIKKIYLMYIHNVAKSLHNRFIALLKST